MAAQLGSLPLVFGMTCFGGLAQIGLSRLIRRFRAFFPTEIAGLVVAAVGLGMAPYGVRMFDLTI
jgi:NCS2 family nucleobase:cation symporter-2